MRVAALRDERVCASAKRPRSFRVSYAWHSRPCLVTGGTGFGGSHLCSELIARGAKVYVLDRVFPGSGLTADANLLIMPNLDAANIAYNLLRVAASGGVTVGPILLGADKPVHILTQTATVRGILNMTALAAVDATQTNTRAMTKLAAE